MPRLAELEPGRELPALEKGPVTRQHLVEWCAAENDYYPLHYDERVALAMALPGTPIQGTYRQALLAQLLERWLGGTGVLRRLTAKYRGLDLEGDRLVARARVRDVEKRVGGGLVTLDVWVENSRGETNTSGEATVELVA